MTKRIKIVILLLSAVWLNSMADNEALYRSLDQAIVQAPDFVKNREDRISNIKERLANATDDEARYSQIGRAHV